MNTSCSRWGKIVIGKIVSHETELKTIYQLLTYSEKNGNKHSWIMMWRRRMIMMTIIYIILFLLMAVKVSAVIVVWRGGMQANNRLISQPCTGSYRYVTKKLFQCHLIIGKKTTAKKKILEPLRRFQCEGRRSSSKEIQFQRRKGLLASLHHTVPWVRTWLVQRPGTNNRTKNANFCEGLHS